MLQEDKMIISQTIIDTASKKIAKPQMAKKLSGFAGWQLIHQSFIRHLFRFTLISFGINTQSINVFSAKHILGAN